MKNVHAVKSASGSKCYGPAGRVTLSRGRKPIRRGRCTSLSAILLVGRLLMTTSDELPSATDCMNKIALAEAEKASAYMRKQAAAEAEKRELLERFEKPSGVSDEERLKRAAVIIKARRGQWTYRGSRRSFSEHAVHRPRPLHQSDGARLGEHVDRPPEGAFPILGAAFEAARLPAAVPDRRLAGRNARGHRYDAGVGLAALPESVRNVSRAFSSQPQKRCRVSHDWKIP